MIMNSAELSAIIDELQETNFTKVDFTILNQETNEPEDIENFIPFSYFKRYMIRKYGSWIYLFPDTPSYQSYDAMHSFLNDWKYFVLNNSNKENWSKLYMSYFYKYNPIENYDKISSVTTEYKGKEKNSVDYSGTEKVVTKFEGSETTTNTTPEDGYTDSTTTLRSPEDTENYTPVDKVENFISARNDSSKIEYSNDRTNTNSREFDERNDSSEKSFEDRTDEVTEHTHGNIGVSTVADMTLKTLEMIKINVSDYILDQFAKEYLLFWG